MTTTIDKFGRILIPKALRKELGIEAGAAVDLILSSFNRSIILKPVHVVDPVVEVNEWGIPSINFGSTDIIDVDFVAAIAEGRDERDDKVLGNA